MKGLYLRNEIMTFAINYSFEDSILKKKSIYGADLRKYLKLTEMIEMHKRKHI